MEKKEVLQLMREQAEALKEHPSYEQLVNQLADLLADSRGRLSKKNFEDLVSLGAALYKAGLSQFTARKDVTELMNKSVSERKTHPPAHT